MLENQEYKKSKSDKGYHAVPPPYTGNFMPPKLDLIFIDEQVESEFVDTVSNEVNTVESNQETADKGVVETNTVRKNIFSPLIIEDWNSDDEEGRLTKKKSISIGDSWVDCFRAAVESLGCYRDEDSVSPHSPKSFCSTPIYNMSIFKVPKTVLNKMENLRRNFFNGIQEGDRKITWVKWHTVLAAKKFGGLGVSSFFALNRGLLAKWVWRFLSQDNSLWCQLISAIHGSIIQIFLLRIPFTWNSIIKEF
ncbi:hypothetical protein Tco_1248251 [Tanacetum coccineum]